MFPQKNARSNSTTSVASAASSSSLKSSTRRPIGELVAHILNQQPNSFSLWSAGNVRVNGRDMSLDVFEALELAAALRNDERIELVHLEYLDAEGDEWKASYRAAASC